MLRITYSVFSSATGQTFEHTGLWRSQEAFWAYAMGMQSAEYRFTLVAVEDGQ